MSGSDWSAFGAVLARLVEAGLDEDAAARDVTTMSLGERARSAGKARFEARSRLVVCGWPAVEMVYGKLGGLDARQVSPEGAWIGAGTVVGTLAGPVGRMLTGERVALNILGRLSGIATLTGRFVEAVRETGVEILDTRKTTPGMRALERYAVRCGGGVNHRFDLSAMAMFKDNHLAAIGGGGLLGDAVRAARAAGVPVEIEVDGIGQLDRALALAPDRILLDNMSPDQVREAVERATGSGCYIEASGGITLGTVRDYASTGVDGISVGSLTHSAPAADISLDWEEPC